MLNTSTKADRDQVVSRDDSGDLGTSTYDDRSPPSLYGEPDPLYGPLYETNPG